MKILRTKERFIKSVIDEYQNKEEGLREGLKFWKESLKILKRIFWIECGFSANPAYMIDFCRHANDTNGVER